MKKEEVKLHIDYINIESMSFFNSLIRMQSENIQEVKALRTRLDELESDLRIYKRKQPLII